MTLRKNFQYLFSFIWPITLKKAISDINGPIEIVMYGGKKMLNSHNANYSYGNLHKAVVYVFKKIVREKVSGFKNILLLGLGGGSAVNILRQDYRSKAQITAVELDSIIIDWAENEYGLKEDKLLKIVNDDAFDFVKGSKSEYDFVLVDIFIDTEIPAIFSSFEFYTLLENILEKDGVVVVNTINKFDSNKKFKLMLEKVFYDVTPHFNKTLQNEMFILSK